MDYLHNNLLSLIGASLTNTPAKLTAPIDWDKLYDLLIIGKLNGVTYKCASTLSNELMPPKSILENWKYISFKHGIRQLFFRHQLSLLLQSAKEQDIQLVLFKGITLATLYPDPNMRFSCDADIYVAPSQRKKAEALLVAQGYIIDMGASKEHVPVYRIAKNGQSMKIELHDSLWEDYEGKQISLLDSLGITDNSTFIEDSFLGISGYTLGYTEHLIYQIFHIAKHFAFEGLPLRYLTDITVYLNAHHNNIDYNRFWESVRLLKYDIFTSSILRICEEYFGLIPRIIPPQYRDVQISQTFLLDLIHAGKVSDHEIEHWASTEMIASYFVRKNEAQTSKLRRWQSTFFPNANELKIHFSYAQKHQILLPIAWIHRFFRACKYHILCKKKGYSSTEALNKANYRIDLLNQLNMLETK